MVQNRQIWPKWSKMVPKLTKWFEGTKWSKITKMSKMVKKWQ